MIAWLAAAAISLAIGLSSRPSPGTRVAAWNRQVSTRRGFGASVALLAGAGAFAVVGGTSVPIVVGAVIAVAVVRQVRQARQAAMERDRCSAAAVELTFALAGELRAGRTPSQALAAAAVTAGPLRHVVDAASVAVSVGASAGQELRRAADQPGAERLRYVAAAWTVTETVGGRIAVVLERLSEAMDDDDELRRELDAAMAGPHATMAMLAALPLLGLGLGQAVGAHPLHLLLHRPVGWALLAAAAVLDAVGLAATRAIARSAVRP